MEEQVIHIVHSAVELFKKYGLRPVTMDDIARENKISKKTLYKFFTNKEDLVKRAVDLISDQAIELMGLAIDKGGNAIDNLFSMDQVVCGTIENYDPSMEFQLQRYYPEASYHLQKKRRKTFLKFTTENIEKGKKEGLYRKELNTHVITRLYYGRVLIMTEQEFNPFGEMDLQSGMREILIYHIRGMATEKGLKYLTEKLKSYE